MLIGLTGFIGSGKNTVAQYFVDKAGYHQDAFACTLKDACAVIFGWDRTALEGDTEASRQWRDKVDPWWSEKLSIPDFTPRLALQLAGTDALRHHFHPDIWLLTFQRRHELSKNKNTIMTDARFPNEISFIQKLGGKIINISNGDKPVWYDTAYAAVLGDDKARNTMQTQYRDVHESEWAWLNTEHDYIVENTCTLEELEKKIWDLHLVLAGANKTQSLL